MTSAQHLSLATVSKNVRVAADRARLGTLFSAVDVTASPDCVLAEDRSGMEMVRRINQEIGNRANNLTKAVVVFVLAALVTTLLSSAVTLSPEHRIDSPARAWRYGALGDSKAWRYSARGEACSATCSSAGMGCEEGDWGVHGEQSMRVVLEAVGQSPAALCRGGFDSSIMDYGPYVYEPSGWCTYMQGPSRHFRPRSTSCSAVNSVYRRLCRCV